MPVRAILPCLLAALCWSGCASVPMPALGTRDLPALIQVDEGLYRGGQPTTAGIRQLAAMGIKTVVCLRHPGRVTREERRLTEGLGMRWVQLPMWIWWRPSDPQIREFLDVAASPTDRPVFVHCRQGWNRSGIMVAIYRIAYQGWAPREAYLEARRHGLVAWNPFTRRLLFRETPQEHMRQRAVPALPPAVNLDS